jgi:hypothetical protein
LKSIIQQDFCAATNFENLAYFIQNNLHLDFPFDFVREHFGSEIKNPFITEKEARHF